MTFEEILDQAVTMLQRRGRVAYRTLKRQFQLDEDALEDLKIELIKAQRLAIDEEGEVLVWTGGASTPAVPFTALLPDQEGPHTDQRLGDASPPAETRISDAERRHLTVLFCDLVDSTALAARLDPEDYRDVVRAYHQVSAEVMQRFEGHIAQYLGDGLLVHFGYPLAHEDDAQRAVRAGLGILAAIEQLNTLLQPGRAVRLAVRVGVHTGLVVVGEIEGGRGEQLALGETPNVAARLQALAMPNTVVISAATYRLVEGYFAYQDLGLHPLKGIATPVPVYRVLGESGAKSRLEVAGSRGLTPLVGREEELRLLLQRWTQVKEGLGQVVVLSGEPGIGKSRLVEAIKGYIATEPHTLLECRCSSYYAHTAFYPIIDLFERELQFTRDGTAEAKLHKLEKILTRYNLPLSEIVPPLAALLSLPLPERYSPLILSPHRQRQRTLEALLAVLLAMAGQQPALLIIEDLQWVDPSTLELLSLLIDQTPTVHLLLVLTCRPEFRPSWTFRSHLTQLMLTRFTRLEIEDMVQMLTGGKALPAEVMQQIVARTDGVPLFVEELTKMVIESELVKEEEIRYELRAPLLPLAIPTTLQDLLMARLDRLVTAKGVAQLCATLGRIVPYELLQAVTPMDETALQRELTSLVKAELLYQRGIAPQATYIFKHALIQEAAYASLLRSTRQRNHQQIARALTAHFPDIVAAQPELLAHHYMEAGLSAQAIPYWLLAGQHAIEHSGYAEAVSHLTKGLEALRTMPDGPERTQHELMLLLALGPPLLVLKGNTALEVEEVYTRAEALCQQVGEIPQVFEVLVGLWQFHLNRAQLPTTLKIAERSLSLARSLHNPRFLQEAHAMLGSTLFFMGNLASARVHLAPRIALRTGQYYRSGAIGRLNPKVVCLVRRAWTLWMLGYPDQALTRVYEGLSLAQELANPYTLGFASHYTAILHQARREAQRAQERAEATLALGRERGFIQWICGGMFVSGWALAEQGLAEDGIAQIRQALADWRAMRTELAQTHVLVRLAEAYGRGGQAEAGLRVLDEALRAIHYTEERYHEAEVYRLKGELLRQSGVQAAEEAEACFRQALDVARHQQAKSLELRAAMSLSYLWQTQNTHSTALSLLEEIYDWFTEGFETPDLQEAQALLVALR